MNKPKLLGFTIADEQQRYKSQPDVQMPGQKFVQMTGCFDSRRNNDTNCSPNGPNTSLHDFSKQNLIISKAKIEASSLTSKVFAGFSMAAAAELQTNGPDETTIPDWLWIAYILCTTLLIVVHAFSILISSHILPNIEEISEDDKFTSGIRIKYFVEIIWLFSNLLGLFLFLVELGLLLWVKFWDFSINAAMAGTVIVIPSIVVFLIFASHSYDSLVNQKLKSSVMSVNELETMVEKLDSCS